MSFKLLDLFCGAGGAARGYELAGFTEIVGVDIERQHSYPYCFVCGDAVEYLLTHGRRFDVIHASPPCQFASWLTEKKHRKKHSNWIPATRASLSFIGRPWVIENVAGARNYLINPIMLCGTMFGLKVQRHRFFEINPRIAPPITPCDHSFAPVVPSGTTRRGERRGIHRRENTADEVRQAMEIPWMIRTELDEAIPPAFTEYIGKKLIANIIQPHRPTSGRAKC